MCKCPPKLAAQSEQTLGGELVWSWWGENGRWPFPLPLYSFVRTTTWSGTAEGRIHKKWIKGRYLYKSQAGPLYLLSGKKKQKQKQSHLRGTEFQVYPLFRHPYTLTMLGDINSLLLVLKERISRSWNVHAHKQGSHRLRETSRESPQRHSSL